MRKKGFPNVILNTGSGSLLFISSTFFWGCSEPPATTSGVAQKPIAQLPKPELQAAPDTTGTFQVEGYRIIPAKEFDFNTLEKSGSDTLKLVTCGRYVIAPFGKLDGADELPVSQLRGFTMKTIRTRQENGVFTMQEMHKSPNRLLLYFEQDPEADSSSFVFKGEIKDNTVHLASGAVVGMPTGSFYKLFFKSFPAELQNRYKVVVFDYCVDNIRHAYRIENNKLVAIEFSQPYSFWKVDY